jgi:glucokinase
MTYKVSEATSLLAVDVGGTKVTVATYLESHGGLTQQRQQTFASNEHASLEEILGIYLQSETQKLAAIAAGVAGPVLDGKAKITNLPWTMDQSELVERYKIPVTLVNDLVAHGFGLAVADPSSVVTLQEGTRKAFGPGYNAALIAAGTGLGEAILFWDGKSHIPSPSEGGHSDFAPGRITEVPLLTHVLQRYKRVSWERIVSGLDGFRNIYMFLRDSKQIAALSNCDAALEADRRADLGEMLITAATAGNPSAVAVIEHLVWLYGGEAGNLALKSLALSGVFIGGGLAPRLLPWMRSGLFMDGFLAKGRFTDMLKTIPVQIIMDPDLALKGAARLALASL